MTETSVPEPLAFRVDSRDVQGASVVEVAGEVDAHTAPTVRDAVEAAIVPGARVIVDLSGVSFLDSTGLGVLVTALKHVREADGTLDRASKVAQPVAYRLIPQLHEVMPLCLNGALHEHIYDRKRSF